MSPRAVAGSRDRRRLAGRAASRATAGMRWPITDHCLATWNHDFQGRTAVQLRAQVRREVLACSASYLKRHGLDAPHVPRDAAGEPTGPLVVTGHQPELFHPGVWIKNFAAAGIAGATPAASRST